MREIADRSMRIPWAANIPTRSSCETGGRLFNRAWRTRWPTIFLGCALDRIGNEHRVAAGIGRLDIRDCVGVRHRSVEIGLATAARAAQSAAALKTCDFSSCTALR